MTYHSDPASIRALVQPDRVHRDVYTDPDVFALEMEQLWANTWVFVGHDSQIPAEGDYFTTTVGLQPVMMVRQRDGSVRVMRNRCSHKGAKLVSDGAGNVGTLLPLPVPRLDLPAGRRVARRADEGRLRQHQLRAVRRRARPGRGDQPCLPRVRVRPAVGGGAGFDEYFGGSLSSIDYLADRSPEGELEVVGGVLRYMHDSNWKMFVENLNDTMHPMVAHESAAGMAKKLWADKPEDEPKPMAIEQLVPFASGYGFFDKMGVRVFENGHSYSGVHFSIHSSYSKMPDYEAAMVAAYGEERARDILGTVRHNTVYYPSLTIKGAIQSIRVVRPVAVDKTVVESWTFRLKGAPEEILHRTITYNRLINSPMSIVGHDDQYCYRVIQEGLAADGNEWVNLQRDWDPAEVGPPDLTVNGTSEISMRNQFRAWTRFMAPA